MDSPFIPIALTPAQRRLIQQEADREGQSINEFIRDAAFARAILNAGRLDPHDRPLAYFEKVVELVRNHAVLLAQRP